MSKTRSQQRGMRSLRTRQSFARIPQAIDIPNLIEIQKKSFERFIQGSVSPGDRELRGLEEVFRDVFPIMDLNINARIEYVGYEVGIWESGGEEYGGLAGPGIIFDETGHEVIYKEKYKQNKMNKNIHGEHTVSTR